MTHDDDTCPHLVRSNLLEAENARLKAEVENSKRINTELLVLSNRQASDIRRLTKAGDAMASKLELDEKEYLERYGIDTFAMDTRPKVVRAWNAAKEGKQSNG